MIMIPMMQIRLVLSGRKDEKDDVVAFVHFTIVRSFTQFQEEVCQVCCLFVCLFQEVLCIVLGCGLWVTAGSGSFAPSMN